MFTSLIQAALLVAAIGTPAPVVGSASSLVAGCCCGPICGCDGGGCCEIACPCPDCCGICCCESCGSCSTE